MIGDVRGVESVGGVLTRRQLPLYPRGSIADRFQSELASLISNGCPLGTSSKRAERFRTLIHEVAELEDGTA